MRKVLCSTLIIVVIVSMVSAKHHSKKPDPVPSNPEGLRPYDSYAFNSEWPGTVCKQKVCNMMAGIKGSFWNIHGLWPDKDDGNHPFFCTNEPLNFAGFNSQIKTDIAAYWSGLYSSDEEFLNHEWTKHGTCWDPSQGDATKMPETIVTIVDEARSNHNSPMSPIFIELVMMVGEKYNHYATLEKNDFVPNDDTPYKFEDIKAALDSEYGEHTYSVNCVRDEHGRMLLSDITICLDKSYNPKHCLAREKASCDDMIYYPNLETPARKRLFAS